MFHFQRQWDPWVRPCSYIAQTDATAPSWKEQMPEGARQGASWEGARPFQREGPVPRLLSRLWPPVRCRRHRTTLTGWAEWLEAQPGALLLFLLPSSIPCSSSWSNVGKWRPLGQPQFPADSKHSSTLCASSPTIPKAPENNPTQIDHHHGLTQNPSFCLT